MFMYDEVKMIKTCAECGQKINNNTITIQYGNKYLCNSCYKMKCVETQKDIFGDDWMEDSLLEALLEEEAEMKNAVKEEVSIEELRQQALDPYFFCEEYKFPKKKKVSMTPKEMVAYLDKHIVGQDEAKRTLAVAVANHYRRINCTEGDAMIPKSNILLQGSTGCGKTYILKMLAELLEVPFYIADASLITEASYKGNNVETIISGLYQAADQNVEKTQKGIIYLDEFDKLSSRYGHTSQNASVGAGVQRQMLKMIEGCVMEIPKSGSRKGGESVSIHTENILFICGGAFVGIKEEKKASHTIGFYPQSKSQVEKITMTKKPCPDDFINFGIIPEMVGRLPIIVSLNDLTETDLTNILQNTEKSLIKQYCSLLKNTYDVELVFQDSAIAQIAHQAYIRKTGARGLNGIVENIMQEILFEIPSDETICKCVITEDVVKGIAKPHIIRENDLIEMRVS